MIQMAHAIILTFVDKVVFGKAEENPEMILKQFLRIAYKIIGKLIQFQ